MRPADPASTLTRQCQAAIDRGDADAALALGSQLDALCVRSASPGILSAALWYADMGLKVFPLRPYGKQPLPGSRGCKDATTDPDQIRRWWAATPTANVGIATGYRVDVVDIDGPLGVKSWAEAGGVQPDNMLPKVIGTVSTPRAGGTHLYVAADPERRNGAAVAPGIDVRGLGGYVVAPPSFGPKAGVTYRWRRPLVLAEVA